MKNFTKTALLIVLLIAFYSGETQNSKIFWTDAQTGKIQSSNMDGTDVQDIVTGATDPRFISMNAEEKNTFYFTMDEKIMRVKEDGSNLETVITGLSYPMGIVFNDDDGILKMYWADVVDSTIYRANKDGSNVEEVVTSLDQPYAVTFDMLANKMYWTEQNALKRANQNGDSIETVIGWGGPRGVAVNALLGDRKIYWTDIENHNIKRTDIDWMSPEEIVTGLDYPTDIKIDYFDEKLYWAGYGDGKIMKANFDGTEVEEVVTGLGSPQGLFLLPDSTNGIRVEEAGKKTWKLYVKSTTLNYTLTGRSLVKLIVYDGRGISLSELVNGYQNPGEHQVKWDANGYPTGIYFYRLQIDGQVARGKMLNFN
ncbi:MAG: hypothetical protein B6D64_12015 [Bacteroidetes bacterium 4484_276]|nr:MAG: hypothetical protein B6D64_12015 [Bacteroidetes bacterium 4484_276]OYT14029.1 MAG: hypothetical protein B6I19_01945 [Bacteroidetes bacterium 4572_114]